MIDHVKKCVKCPEDLRKKIVASKSNINVISKSSADISYIADRLDSSPDEGK